MRVLTGLIVALILTGSAFGQSSSSSSNSDSVPCAVDSRWLNLSGELNHSRQSSTPTSLSLLVHQSKGSNCSRVEITFTATYLSDNQDFICGGTVRQAMTLTSDVQIFNLEIRPFAQLDFLRWRNQPGVRGIQQGKRLACSNLDGTSDLGDTDRQRAAWVRLSVGVLSNGGLAVTEAIVRVVPWRMVRFLVIPLLMIFPATLVWAWKSGGYPRLISLTTSLLLLIVVMSFAMASPRFGNRLAATEGYVHIALRILLLLPYNAVQQERHRRPSSFRDHGSWHAK